MKVRVLHTIAGTVMGDPNGVKKNQIVEWDDDYALRQIDAGAVQPVDWDQLDPDQRKEWRDRARQAMLDFNLPVQQQTKAMYDEMRRADELAAQRRGDQRGDQRGKRWAWV
jgi:hypothetical protein